MTDQSETVISLDAMGGDAGPDAIVCGLDKALKKSPDVRILLHGPQAQLAPLVQKKRRLRKRVEICDTDGVISMNDLPSKALRNRDGTSMNNAIEAVREGRASTVVSCGNTGALMAISTIALRRMPGVKRPAIAVFWPSLNRQMYNVVLDVGADISADAEDLCRFAHMGAAYARNAFQIARPRVGLLNIGTEDHKGREEVRKAAEQLREAQPEASFDFTGFIEGGDIASASVDVIVTDGFAGNIALKTAEGTAKVIGEMIRQSFEHSPFSRIASFFALTSLRRLKRRVDPRYSNGGVFLGLNGTVIKSHGSADSTAVAAALELAIRLDKKGFAKQVSKELAPRDASKIN